MTILTSALSLSLPLYPPSAVDYANHSARLYFPRNSSVSKLSRFSKPPNPNLPSSGRYGLGVGISSSPAWGSALFAPCGSAVTVTFQERLEGHRLKLERKKLGLWQLGREEAMAVAADAAEKRDVGILEREEEIGVRESEVRQRAGS